MSEKLSERVTEARLAGVGSPALFNLLDEVAAALRAVEGDAWQPIETAPKDGTPVLGCIHLETGGWQKEYEQWRGPTTISFRGFHPNAPGKKQWRDGHGKPYPANYYRPLPAAPLDAGGSAEGVEGG